MNIMNAGNMRFLEQLQTLAEKIGPGNEHPIKTKQEGCTQVMSLLRGYNTQWI